MPFLNKGWYIYIYARPVHHDLPYVRDNGTSCGEHEHGCFYTGHSQASSERCFTEFHIALIRISIEKQPGRLRGF